MAGESPNLGYVSILGAAGVGVGAGESVSVALTVTNGAYSAGDVVGGLITFVNAVSGAGKRAVLYSVKLFGVTAITTELWLFNADIATPAADNAAFALAAGDGAKFLGAFPLSNGDALAAQNSFSVVTAYPNLMVKAAAGSTTIYGYLKHTGTTSPGTTAMNLVADFIYVD